MSMSEPAVAVAHTWQWRRCECHCDCGRANWTVEWVADLTDEDAPAAAKPNSLAAPSICHRVGGHQRLNFPSASVGRH